MTLARTVAANTSYQIAGKLVASSFAFLSTLLLTRYLGANRYGLFVTAGVYYVFFETFMDFGLSQVLVRMSALQPERVPEILSKAMTLKLLVGVGLFLVCTATASLAFGRPGQEVLRQGAVLLSLTFLVTWFTGTYAAYFQYRVKHRVMALSTIFAKCVALIAILLFVQRRLGLLPFFAVNAISWLAALGVLVYFARREGLRLRFAVDGALWRELFRESAPLGMVVLLNVLYMKADLMLLAVFRLPAEVGAYGLAYTVTDFAMAPAGFFMTTLYPTMAARSEDREHIELLLAKAMRVLLVLGFGVFVVVFVCAQHLVLLLGGQGFLIAVLPLHILTVAVLVSYFNAALGHTIIATGHQRVLFRMMVIVLATNLIANLVVIPRWGLRGAAATMILSEGVSLALQVRAIGALGIRIAFPHLGRLLLAGALLIAAVWPWYRHLVFSDLPRNALALVAGAIVVAVSYSFVLGALRIFDARREWQRLR